MLFCHVDIQHNVSCCLGRLSGLGIGRVQLERRTAEGQRILRDNLHTVFEELRPLMEHARSAESHGLSLSWLRTAQQQTPSQQQRSLSLPVLPQQQQQQQQSIPVTLSSSDDSFVITVDTEQDPNAHPYHHQHHHPHPHPHPHGTSMASTPSTTTAENFLNNIREAAAAHQAEHQPNNNNNNVEEGKGLLSLSFAYLFMVCELAIFTSQSKNKTMKIVLHFQLRNILHIIVHEKTVLIPACPFQGTALVLC